MFVTPRPPKFGSRLDFERAVLEVKWLGKKDSDNIRAVAKKYLFPPEFIEAGISSLKPENELIGTSKWWPILVQWNEQKEEVEYRVQRAVAYRAKASRDLIVYPLLAFSIIIELFLSGNNVLAIAGISATMSLFYMLYRRSEDWDLRIEEEVHKSEVEGYNNIAEDFIQLAKGHALFAYYAFKHFSKERSLHIVVEHVDTEVDEKGNPIPVFKLLEERDVEYAKRIQELEQ